MDTKWSDDALLDQLRRQRDPRADRAVARLIDEGGIAAANHVFMNMHADGRPLPPETPATLKEFLEETGRLPAGVDEERLVRGGKTFLDHALAAAVVLLASSLPQGYGSPALCEILTISNDLRFHPYRRLMGVIQLLVNLARPGAFEPGGLALVTAQKLRLLHAGVRSVVPRYRPGYQEKYGPPVNHEDMLATIMAFSYLVVDGLAKLGIRFEHQEDYYYMWHVFARMMGIHPEDDPDSDSLVPSTIAEASVFYAAYSRRQFTMPAENPSGPVLTRENLEMMHHLVPKPLRRLGFDHAPQVVMTQLLGPEALARVGMEADTDHARLEKLISLALKATQWTLDRAPTLTELLARTIFQDMIKHSRGGEVTFVIPDSLAALRGRGLV